jgi:hypothetical protein
VYTHPSSHPISLITGLQGALDGKQALLTAGSVPQSHVTNLTADLSTINAAITAAATEIHLGGTTYSPQTKFSVENAQMVLNVGLGIWQWRVTPLWSQIQRDGARVKQARLGYLPLDPGSDCLAYWPLYGPEIDDLGPSGLHWVSEDTTATQGTWGVYTHASRAAISDQGWLLPAADVRVFPNRDVPNTQVSSRGIGWPSGTSDAWCLEFQVYLSPGKDFWSRINNDADYGLSPAPERFFNIGLRTSLGQLYVNSSNLSLSGIHTTANVVFSDRWMHLAVQKAAGAAQVRLFVDGVSRLTVTPTAAATITNIDTFLLGSGTGALVREVCVRSVAPYDSAGFESSLGDTRLRWNSMML